MIFSIYLTITTFLEKIPTSHSVNLSHSSLFNFISSVSIYFTYKNIKLTISPSLTIHNINWRIDSRHNFSISFSLFLCAEPLRFFPKQSDSLFLFSFPLFPKRTRFNSKLLLVPFLLRLWLAALLDRKRKKKKKDFWARRWRRRHVLCVDLPPPQQGLICSQNTWWAMSDARFFFI